MTEENKVATAAELDELITEARGADYALAQRLTNVLIALLRERDEAREDRDAHQRAAIRAGLDIAKKDAALREIVDTGSDGTHTGDLHSQCCEIAGAALAPAAQGETKPAYKQAVYGHDPQGFIDETSTGQAAAPAPTTGETT